MASKATSTEGEIELLGKDISQPENAGVHPWSIALRNESTLLLFNHTDQEQRATVGIHKQKVDWTKSVKLSPRETLTLNIGNLIKDKIPDDQGRTLPANLIEGEIIWNMRESKTVTGRLLVSNPLAAMARNFSCSANYNLCGCSITPTSGSMPVGGSAAFSANPQWCFSYYQAQCTGSSTSPQGDPEYSWSGGGGTFTLPSSCSGNQNCSPTGNSPGTGTLTLQAQELGCIYTPQATVNVTPTITQDRDLWFFGTGIPTPAGFTLGATSATLTVSGAGNGSYVWTITAGTAQVVFSDNNSTSITKTNVNTVGISSIFESTAANDVTIQLQFTPSGGTQMTTSVSLDVDSPYKLTSGGAPSDVGLRAGSTCSAMTGGTDGYASGIPYNIVSFFGQQITNIYVNETFGARHNGTTNNWPSPTQGAYPSTDGTFGDCVLAVLPSGTPPSKPPQNPLLSQEIMDLTQTWYIGSQTNGSGIPVQFDNITYYQDHGRHLSITSPVR